MRRSTVSDTSTGKNKPASDNDGSRAGGLTLRILSVNVLPLFVLVVGLLSLGRYQENLINETLKTLQEQARTFAIAIEGPDGSGGIEGSAARDMIAKLAVRRQDTRIWLYDPGGGVIGDSLNLTVETAIMETEGDANIFGFSEALAFLGTTILELLPTKAVLPRFPYDKYKSAHSYPDFEMAMAGNPAATAWDAGQGRIVLTAAAPVIKNGGVSGVVLLVNDGRDIEAGMDQVRFDVLTATLAALSLTIFLSFYLAGIIGRPLKNLADAAEKVRQSKGRQINIPDLSRRNDEIGELSMALRHMTQALWDRMDTIERFAADVAHEIKNPLTSLRSAVETAAKVTSGADRARLMTIIQHDVQRLDRLISDISNASRLDAELSRDEMGSVDLGLLLGQIAESCKKPLTHDIGSGGEESPVRLETPSGKSVIVRGNEGRLAQVFRNLIDNALSFSPAGGRVCVRIVPGKKTVTVTVDDEGPGIPDNKREDIFERFYSERPKEEAYGSHSGLGLSIARQIVTAHGGRIFAENIPEGGARFTVVLDRAE